MRRHPITFSLSSLLFFIAACGGSAPAQEPPAAPVVTSAAPGPAPQAPVAAPAEPSAEPATAAPTPAEPPAADPAPVSKCGVGGTARARATTCDFLLVKGGAECCFAKKDDACREAGCAASKCDLLKSNPPQVACRN